MHFLVTICCCYGTQHMLLQVVLCMAWLQAKIQAKPNVVAWLQDSEAKAKPASHGFK